MLRHMGRKSDRLRRARSIRALEQAAGVDRDLAEHMYDRQIAPQERAADLRRQGVSGEIAFVSTAATADGHAVKCSKCGRTARMPVKPPPGAALICPLCLDR